ncbi:MAG: hypothetical protein OHK0039_16060 [Bacteroidia bacterium]
MKKYYLLLAGLFPLLLAAQPEMGMSFLYTRPLDVLADAGYRPGAGFAMELLSPRLHRQHPVNLQLGVSTDFSIAGNETFDLEHPDYTDPVELGISNHVFGMHGISRLITTDRLPVQLYGDFLLGGRMFYSSEYLDTEPDNDDNCVETTNIARRATLSYGAAGGLRWRLGPNASIDLRATYLTGNEAPFVDMATTRVAEPGIVTYDMARATRSNVLQFQAGISIRLVDTGNCQPCRSRMSCSGYPAYEETYPAPLEDIQRP